MLILSWIAFGLVNAFIISLLDTNRESNMKTSVLLGITGALSGGVFAYLLFAGSEVRQTGLPLLLLAVDFFIMAFMLRSRMFRLN